eukprot:TRINITY_DN4244_c0_g1_i1.p1 TRINITY_DN4244_c0_g1~~TRINITY_DN4244_c0_g1_i1.p1  ORF type:complete len:850 (+),score=200.72 TRINITY_DN4244_c0_g1_i1:86-2635(+)
MPSGLGLGYDGSSSSAEEDMRPKKRKSKKGTAIAWLGEGEMDEEEEAWFGKKKESSGIVNKSSSGGVSFVKSAVKLDPETEKNDQKSTTSPTPESRSPTPEPVIPPKTGKYSVSFISPTKKSESPPPAQKSSRQQLREANRVTSFLGSATTSKVLKMMKGWKPGQGMGKDGTGIREAIDVKVRPAKVGLGSIDELTDQQKRLDREAKGIVSHDDYSLEEELSLFGKKQHGEEPLTLRNINLSRKDSKSNKKKAAPTTNFSFGGTTTVIDMSTKTAVANQMAKKPFLADLRTNIRRSEHEVLRQIQYLDEKLTEENRSKQILESQINGDATDSPEMLADLNHLIEKLKEIQLQARRGDSGQVDEIDFRRKRKKGAAKQTPGDIANLVKQKLLSTDEDCQKFSTFHNIYKQEINRLLISIAYPSFDNFYLNWDVQKSPREGIPFIIDWQTITTTGSTNTDDEQECIQTLVTAPVGKKLRTYISDWDPSCSLEDHQTRATLLSEWTSYLTKQAKHFLIKQCILKVSEGLHAYTLSELSLVLKIWKPVCTIVSRYGQQSLLEDDAVKAAVKSRLLSECTSSELTLTQRASALIPWKVLLGSEFMPLFQKLVSKPLLKRLNNASLNPAADPPAWLSEVSQLCGIDSQLRDSVCAVLKFSLIPRLTFVLAHYTKQTGDINRACALYRTIRSSCPSVTTMNLRIPLTTCVKLLLVAKNWCSENRDQLPSGDVVFDYDHVNKMAFERLASVKKRTTTVSPDITLSADVTTRDHIVSLAEESGLLFAPKPNIRVDGKQVYALGRLLIYIDANVVFVQNGDSEWEPAESLLGVIDIAQSLEQRSTPQQEDSAQASMDID